MKPALPPAPRYSPAQLAQLMEISSVVKCECPNHLAQIVSNVIAFEEYAAECESQSPEDAAMHALLHEAAAQARVILDRALSELVAFEGIELR